MSERHFGIKIRPQYYLYFGSLVLFVAGAGSCGHAIAVDIRAHDEADRLYENGTSENSLYAAESKELLNHRDYLTAGAFALSASAGLGYGGVLLGSWRNRKKPVSETD